MCGIVGVYAPRPVANRGRMARALSTMHSRGPDDSGEFWSEDGRVGLGHRRLAVSIAPQSRQPILQAQTAAVVNGEFYGLPPAPWSDSHELPRLYRRHGMESTLQRLRGEFAFLLYDPNVETLFAVRDRFGIKPLYWARLGEEIWFASKPSALWAVGVRPDWSPDSFWQAAATQYPAPGQSLFQGIESVPPGHILTLKPQDMSLARYWSVPVARPGQADPDQFLPLFQAAVAERLPQGRPSAVLLSGGVDSASVAAAAAAVAQSPLVAYTVDFTPHSAFSEGRLASRQANRLGLPHRCLDLSGQEILDELAAAVGATEGLCVNGHLVAKRRLARAVQTDGLKVLLSGEGADELLYGYRHFAPYFSRPVDPTEDLAGLGILTTIGEHPLPETWPRFFHSKWALGQRILALLGTKRDTTWHFERLLRSSPIGESKLEAARRVWLETALSSYILETLGDGTEMAHSVEGRPPFLDHRLWELAAGLVHDGTKAPLREESNAGVLPSLRRRPKHPFMAPSLGHPLIGRLEERVRWQKHPFLDRARALETLELVRRATSLERLEWEPALLWVLSSFYLQETLQGQLTLSESYSDS